MDALNRPVFLDLNPVDGPPPGFNKVELKMDGQWGQLKIENGSLEIWSRHGKLKLQTRVPKAPDMIVHGEFLYGSNWAIQRGMAGQFYAFDIISYRDTDISDKTLKYRRSVLTQYLSLYSKAYGLPEWLRVLPQYPVSDWRDLWDFKVLNEGYEGLIFKHSDAPFGEQWARMKRVFTVDYVCVGVNISEAPKYAGQVASIKAGLYIDGELKHVGNVHGLTDAQRLEFLDGYEGKVFEATGRGLFTTGALRHPNFVRWHSDKEAGQCTL